VRHYRAKIQPAKRGSRAPVAYLIGFCPSFGHGVILIAGSAAHSDGPDDLALPLERDATSKNHDLSVVGCVDSEELAAGLGMSG
jgi:hypothetical protein